MMKNFTENFIFMPETSKASMKPDQERVKTLLTDTVTLLCKNGLQYSKELKVQGLLGITLDNDDVFVVHINEIFNGLLGAQVSSLKAEETRSATSAIAAADSATSDVPLKSSSRKGIPQKYENSSPSGSSKRKAHTPTPVKKEYHSEDEIVIMDSKSMDSDEFNDEIGDGDREAMRKSYGEMLEPPVAKRRVADSSGAFRDKQSSTFFSGIVADTKAELGESDDILDDSSLENSTGLGNMTTDGQTLFENSAGCSAWEGTGAGPPTQTESGQDSTSDIEHTYAKLTLPTDVPEGTQFLIMNSSFDEKDPSFMVKIEDSFGQMVEEMKIIQAGSSPSPTKQFFGNEESFTESFDDEKALETHKSQHKRVARRSTAGVNKPYPCAVRGCSRTYYNCKDLKRHMRVAHQLFYHGPKLPRRTALKIPYTCPFVYCFVEFIGPRLLEKHITDEHSMEIIPECYIDDGLEQVNKHNKNLINIKPINIEPKDEDEQMMEADDEISVSQNIDAEDEDEDDRVDDEDLSIEIELPTPVISRGPSSVHAGPKVLAKFKDRYACSFKGCHQSYHLNNSLVRHMRDRHNLMEIMLDVMNVLPKEGSTQGTYYECRVCFTKSIHVGGAVRHYHEKHGALPGECKEEA